MKRFLALITLFALLFSFAACGIRQDGEAAASPEPTEAADNTAAPTAVVTPEPEATPEPTATPEPAPVPDPVQYAFEDCAEVVARLPWGEADNEVFYEPPDGGPGIVPNAIYAADGKVCILDRWFYSHSILTYDLAAGETDRLNITDTRYGLWTAFVIDGGKLISPHMIYDLETGEETLLQPLPVNDSPMECYRSLYVRDGKCYISVAEPRFVGSAENESPLVTEYMLDEANLMWKPMRAYLRIPMTGIVLVENGAVLTGEAEGFDNGEDCYLGYDGSDRHYVASWGSRSISGESGMSIVVSKFSPEGSLEAHTVFDIKGEYRYPTVDLAHSFFVADDGTVWFMMFYEEEVVVYRIEL